MQHDQVIDKEKNALSIEFDREKKLHFYDEKWYGYRNCKEKVSTCKIYLAVADEGPSGTATQKTYLSSR